MKVVSVKFKENGRAYYFDPGEFKIKRGGRLCRRHDGPRHRMRRGRPRRA